MTTTRHQRRGWLLLASLLCCRCAAAGSAAAATTTAAATADDDDDADPRRAQLAPCALERADADAAAARLARALTFETVGSAEAADHVGDGGGGDGGDPRRRAQFEGFLAWLEGAYPRAFAALDVERLGDGGYSLLLTWRGSSDDDDGDGDDPSRSPLPPVLFVSHYDVVPVDGATRGAWTHAPFGGDVAGGFVWGRGALDVKSGVVGLMEAVERLLQNPDGSGGGSRPFAPRRTLLLAFGHDEELGGGAGAARIAAALEARGVKLAAIVDEGGIVKLDGVGPAWLLGAGGGPVALVSTAEKAFYSLRVALAARGGHSSMPPADGSGIEARLGRLLAAIAARPPPPRLVAPMTHHVTALAELAPPGVSLLLRALPGWLVARLLARSGRAELAALVRTTAAVTRVRSGGVAGNVLPQRAEVDINFRLLPGDGPDDARRYVEGWLGSDAAFATVTPLGAAPVPEARPPPADPDSAVFATLRRAIQGAWRLQGDTGSGPAAADPAASLSAAPRPAATRPIPVLPLLLSGMTDSRHYARLLLRQRQQQAPNGGGGVLRLSPGALNARRGDLARIHGVDERLPVADLACAVEVYERALRGFGEGDEEAEGVERGGGAGAQQRRQEEL